MPTKAKPWDEGTGQGGVGVDIDDFTAKVTPQEGNFLRNGLCLVGFWRQRGQEVNDAHSCGCDGLGAASRGTGGGALCPQAARIRLFCPPQRLLTPSLMPR